MESKEMIRYIRKKNGLSQEAMARRMMVTRQAVSRWENGETTPDIDTLKRISKEFNVSINTLLGSPRQLICQCCGMPLYEDDVISKEPDGGFNEDYCKWCFVDGNFVYDTMEELMAFLVPHMATMHHREQEEVGKMLKEQLPKLKHWREHLKEKEKTPVFSQEDR